YTILFTRIDDVRHIALGTKIRGIAQVRAQKRILKEDCVELPGVQGQTDSGVNACACPAVCQTGCSVYARERGFTHSEMNKRAGRVFTKCLRPEDLAIDARPFVVPVA